jgi:hypothetical protein
MPFLMAGGATFKMQAARVQIPLKNTSQTASAERLNLHSDGNRYAAAVGLI